MSNMADLQLTFLTPCERCAGLLFGKVAFCPYCGGAAAVIFGDRTPASGNEIDPAENDFSDSTLGLLAKRQMARPGAVRRQAASGTVALFLLIVLALVLGYNQLGNREDDTPDARSLISRLGLAEPRQAIGGLLRAEERMPQKPDPEAGRGRLVPTVAAATALPVIAAASETSPVPEAVAKPTPPARTAAAKPEPPAKAQPVAGAEPSARTAACNDMLSALALCGPTQGAAPPSPTTAIASTAAASTAPTPEAALDALQVKPNR
ncbi:conserved hypothetical protein [Burkholderiales bacterium 8X]|nr:conserved hypothetical protein [Burkholderiales bacterium 8X]